MKSVILRYRQKQMEAVKAAFKHFIAEEKTTQKKKAIKQVIIENSEHQQAIDFQNEQQSQKRERVKREVVSSSAVLDKEKKKVSKTVSVLTRRNQDLVFASRKRTIFLAWRHAVKQELAFLWCIKNVLTKSMLTKGFLVIKETTRDTMIVDRKYKLLNKAFLKFKHGVVVEYFNRWKRFNLLKVLGNDECVLNRLHEEKDRFANKIKNVKDQNTKNMFEVLRKRRLQKVFD